MQQYPNYYQQAPLYPNSYQPYQNNPYMDRMNNLQQYQQCLQHSLQQGQTNQFSPFGKIVESMEMVKATDIPMDGNMYYFPTADGSSVFGKRWMPNGQTQILAYKPVLEDNPNIPPVIEEKLKLELSDEITNIFLNRFDELKNRIDELEKFLTKGE